MTTQDAREDSATREEPKRETPPWLRATVEDVQTLDFEGPIKGSTVADCHQLGARFQEALARTSEGTEPPDTAANRVFGMLSAVTGIRFTPEHRSEPFAPMAVLSDGRRSPSADDFRGVPLDALAYMAERAVNPVLRARLSDVSWLLDRRRGILGALALSSYVEIIRRVDKGELKFPFANGGGVLVHGIRDYLRRALQIGHSIGWDKPETLAARRIAVELRVRANGQRAPVPVYQFSELDLDFGVSDAAEVASGIDTVLKALSSEPDFHTVVSLWRLAARAYHLAKNDGEARRCQAEAAERLVAEAEAALSQHSAMLASHHLSEAIAELHGISGKKDRRTKLRHRLIDIQARIPDEMSSFSHEMDLRELAERVEKNIEGLSLLDKLLAFAALARSPQPEHLIKQALKTIREHPLSAIFGASHHDREGKVIHRTEGGISGNDASDPVVQREIAQAESIRRNVASFGIDVARRAITERHYLSDDVFKSLLRYSPFVPQDLLATFARGFTCFFRGDFVSAVYILTPLLENSLRHVLKAYGHDITIFDDAKQTQQDRTISSLFEQMRSELDVVFTTAITTDIENVFLKRPGPYLRHSLAHGLLHDGDPYGPDAIYGCWFIVRLCLLPLFPYKDKIKLFPEAA